ncbi:hypothetical protein [Terriglobus sp.]|uniref:hypothetical protein n=1 Tax=Terriglobus sp. TaxID=1889013 RepID=UPI003AFF7CA4
MSSVPKLDDALKILRDKGQRVEGGAVTTAGEMLVNVDGKLLTYSEVYELAGMAR